LQLEYAARAGHYDATFEYCEVSTMWRRHKALTYSLLSTHTSAQ